MKMRIFACTMSALLLATTSWADDKEKDEDRLKNAGTVLTEISEPSRRHSSRSPRQSRLCGCFPIGSQGRVCGRWQLWPRCDDVPQRRKFYGLLGRAFNDGP